MNPEEKARSSRTNSEGAPFVLVHSQGFSDVQKAEAEIHRLFADLVAPEGPEFFNVSVGRAIDVLRGMPNALEETEPDQGPSPWMNDVGSLVNSGQRLQAIAAYRNATGAGLKESKDSVDRMYPPRPMLSERWRWFEPVLAVLMVPPILLALPLVLVCCLVYKISKKLSGQ